jgi:hypothetical protein
MENIAQDIKTIFDPYFAAPLDVWECFVQNGEIIEKQKKRDTKKK